MPQTKLYYIIIHNGIIVLSLIIFMLSCEVEQVSYCSAYDNKHNAITKIIIRIQKVEKML